MNKKLFILLVVAVGLVVGVGVAVAQGHGNQVCDPQQPRDCLSDPQMDAYGYGGMGFVNPQTGAQWNGQQQGRMGRGTGLNGTGFYTAMPPAYDGELPQDVINLMLDGWMDEQHAYAVYDAVIAQFGETAPFVNIQRAEAQHIAAWEFLFDRYGIEIPDVPEFEILEFASVADACTTAAAAEIANFDLYDTMLETFAEYPDIYQVTLSLRNASEFNHLPAFQSCAN